MAAAQSGASRRRGRKRARTVSFAEPDAEAVPAAAPAAAPAAHRLPAKSNPRLWQVGPKYKIHEKGYLGRGSYGEVAEATDLSTGSKVAIKRVRIHNATEVELKRLLREVTVLKSCRGAPHIVQLLDIVAADSLANFNEVFMVFEYVETDLYKITKSNQLLSERHVQHIMYQILTAMNFLESASVIHRDIKPANLLISLNCRVHLADFGLARVVRETQTKANRRRAYGSFDVDELMHLQPAAAPTVPPSPPPGDAQPGAKRPRRRSSRLSAARPSPALTHQVSSGTASDSSSDTYTGAGEGGEPPAPPASAPPLVGGASAGSAAEHSQQSTQEHNVAMFTGEGPGTPTEEGGAGEAPPTIVAPGPEASSKRSAAMALTHHVVTRWYRCPELILLQDYGHRVDMWSIGCVLAELLQMLPGVRDSVSARGPLFPGDSCFPLSVDVPNAYANKFDQLNIIFKVLGTPSPAEIAALPPCDARTYLEALRPRKGSGLAAVLPGAPSGALDLLESMLAFSPAKRITVAQALDHPFLAGCRDVKGEVKATRPFPTMDIAERPNVPAEDIKALLFFEAQRFASARQALATVMGGGALGGMSPMTWALGGASRPGLPTPPESVRAAILPSAGSSGPGASAVPPVAVARGGVGGGGDPPSNGSSTGGLGAAMAPPPNAIRDDSYCSVVSGTGGGLPHTVFGVPMSPARPPVSLG